MLQMTNEYGVEETQRELLDIMKILHDFCEKKGIQYFLYGGSCLGAVRHKGFIPWDDDMDICVDRTNYNKLISYFDECEELSIHKTIWVYRIQKKCDRKKAGYIPTVDVFVNDNAPNNIFVFQTKIFLLSALQGMLKEQVVYKNYSLKYKVLLFSTHLFGKLFSKESLFKKYESVSQIGNKNPTTNVHCTNSLYNYIRKKYPSDTFKAVFLTDFEDTKFYIPIKYDTYLKTTYGDYMKLPDIVNRKPEHLK